MTLFSDITDTLQDNVPNFDSLETSGLSRREFLIICSAFAAVTSMPSLIYAKPSAKSELKAFPAPDKTAALLSAYPATITVLKTAYLGEIKAHLHYIRYAEKARKENFPNIAYLFTAFAASEYTHAREFKALLADLGINTEEFSGQDVSFASTKSNLKTAAKNELEKIETVYPGFLNKLRLEKHADAQKNCLYAWKSHEQHSAHLKKLIKWSGFFFGLLAKKFEDNPVKYFVCRICGSTLIKIPPDSCPICARPVTEYRLIEKNQTDFI